MGKEDILAKYNVEFVPIGSVRPYENNPRFNDDAVSGVAKSISLYGWQSPIIVDEEMVVIAGHTRLKAAQSLGLKEVLVHVAKGLSPEKAKAFRLDDNRTAENSKWDLSKLGVEFNVLKEEGYDISQLAFDGEEIKRAIASAENADNEGMTDADEEPEFSDSAEADSKPGHTYRLGKHVLRCGDSSEGLDVMEVLKGDGEKPVKLYLTDPPYNVDFKGKTEFLNEYDGYDRNADIIHNDKMEDGKFTEMLTKVFTNAVANMDDKCSYYVFTSPGGPPFEMVVNAIKAAGLRFQYNLCWAKNDPVIGRADYNSQTEAIIYGWNVTHVFYGEGECKTTLWKYDRTRKNTLHPTMKPVNILVNAIMNSSQKGDIVLDTFGGSGSTLIACEKTGRKCRMIEMEPRYCDVIRRRWAEFVEGEGCDWKAMTPEIQ